jgi:hypothetical protein
MIRVRIPTAFGQPVAVCFHLIDRETHAAVSMPSLLFFLAREQLLTREPRSVLHAPVSSIDTTDKLGPRRRPQRPHDDHATPRLLMLPTRADSLRCFRWPASVI